MVMMKKSNNNNEVILKENDISNENIERRK